MRIECAYENERDIAEKADLVWKLVGVSLFLSIIVAFAFFHSSYDKGDSPYIIFLIILQLLGMFALGGIVLHSTNEIPVWYGRKISPEQSVVVIACLIILAGNLGQGISSAWDKHYGLFWFCVIGNSTNILHRINVC